MPFVVVALAALAGAHAFDYVTFLVMIGHHGLAAELNPIVQRLAASFGLAGLTIAKSASVAFLASTFVIIAPRRRKLAASVLTIGIAAGLVGGFSNVASI